MIEKQRQKTKWKHHLSSWNQVILLSYCCGLRRSNQLNHSFLFTFTYPILPRKTRTKFMVNLTFFLAKKKKDVLRSTIHICTNTHSKKEKEKGCANYSIHPSIHLLFFHAPFQLNRIKSIKKKQKTKFLSLRLTTSRWNR